MSVDDLAQIIQRAQQGDRDAVDLTAEVFLNMVKRLPGFHRTGAPFEAWLYRIASALIADFYRKAGRRPEAELAEWLSDYSPQPEEQLQRQQEIESARAALQELSEEQQTIVFLRFRERKSHEEVAQILGKSVDAVRSAQYRALSRLAALLGSEGKARHYLRGEDG
jgi:RNA polymerase sigma-70 factor (ECF subfamily)